MKGEVIEILKGDRKSARRELLATYLKNADYSPKYELTPFKNELKGIFNEENLIDILRSMWCYCNNVTFSTDELRLCYKNIKNILQFVAGDNMSTALPTQANAMVIHFLFDAGIDPNIKMPEGNLISTCVHHMLPDSPRTVETIKLLHSLKVDIHNTYTGITPMSTAVAHNNHIGIKYLVSLRASVNKQNTSAEGDSPLHTAVKTYTDNYWPGKNMTIELLVALKADLNALNNSITGDSPLHIAVRDKKINVIKLLVALKADLNVRNNSSHGDSPLHIAVKSWEIDDIKLLAELKADVNVLNGEHTSPLDCAKSPDMKYPDTTELRKLVIKQRENSLAIIELLESLIKQKETPLEITEVETDDSGASAAAIADPTQNDVSLMAQPPESPSEF